MVHVFMSNVFVVWVNNGLTQDRMKTNLRFFINKMHPYLVVDRFERRARVTTISIGYYGRKSEIGAKLVGYSDRKRYL